MSKKNKRQSSAVSYGYIESENHSSHVNYPVDLPEVTNMDELASLSDVELNAKSGALHADRAKVVDRGLDPRPWDVELMYVYREYQLRRIRKDSHEQFLRTQARLFAEEEAGLPSADFDNLQFVRMR